MITQSSLFPCHWQAIVVPINRHESPANAASQMTSF
jgi:hypothetical protein